MRIDAADPAGQARRRASRVAIRDADHRLTSGARCPSDLRPSLCGTGTARIHHALYLKPESRARSQPHWPASSTSHECRKALKKGGSHRQPRLSRCAGKLIKGKKRPCSEVDTQGLLLHGIVTAADVQDRDGGLALLATLFGHVRRQRLSGAGLSTGPRPASPLPRPAVGWSNHPPRNPHTLATGGTAWLAGPIRLMLNGAGSGRPGPGERAGRV